MGVYTADIALYDIIFLAVFGLFYFLLIFVIEYLKTVPSISRIFNGLKKN